MARGNKKASHLGTRGRALLAFVFRGRSGFLSTFVFEKAVNGHLCKAIGDV